MAENGLDWQDFDSIANRMWAILPIVLIYALINQYLFTFDPSFWVTHTSLGVTVSMIIFCEAMKALSTNWQNLWAFTFRGIE